LIFAHALGDVSGVAYFIAIAEKASIKLRLIFPHVSYATIGLSLFLRLT